MSKTFEFQRNQFVFFDFFVFYILILKLCLLFAFTSSERDVTTATVFARVFPLLRNRQHLVTNLFKSDLFFHVFFV